MTTNDALPAPLSRVTRRIQRASAAIALDQPSDLVFQHTVLCQTALPYRALDTRLWQRRNGQVELEIEAGRVRDPAHHRWIPVPLPYGARARLILMHLNREALRTQHWVIETDDSLTAWVRKLLGRPPRGRDIRSFRDQLTHLAAAHIRLALSHGGRTVQVNGQIVDALDLWAPSHPDQQTLWTSIIELNRRYFESLMRHAVPLDERAVAALAHSALALDIYTWLAQRLHRVPNGRGQFVPWPAIHEQFGGGYQQIRQFRGFFLKQLRAVQTQYPQARIEADETGVRLRNSPPPVPPRLLVPGYGTTLSV